MSWKIGLFASFLSGALFAAQEPQPTQSFAIIGDAGKYNANTKAVQQSIARSGLRRLILPGDNLYSGTYAQQWSPWAGFEFSVVAIGNHTAGYQQELKYFAMPAEYYAKDVGGIRFLVLNSDNSRTVNEQAEWLEDQLANSNGFGGATFLVWHHPPYTVSSYHAWKEKATFQTRVRSLLKTYADRITGLLVGHDHIGAVYCLDSMPMIVSGAIWDTRTPNQKAYRDSADGTMVTPQWVYPEGTVVWARLDYEPATATGTIQFIRATDDQVLYRAAFGPTIDKALCAF